jgi:hypothetical protein
MLVDAAEEEEIEDEVSRGVGVDRRLERDVSTARKEEEEAEEPEVDERGLI